MSTALRTAIAVLGLGFLYVGITGLFRPEALAAALALVPEPPAGLGTVRAMVGGHYLAMGLTAVYAAFSQRGAWLVPLAAIEGCMLLARVLSGVAGELNADALAATALEVAAVLLFTLGALKLKRSSPQV